VIHFYLLLIKILVQVLPDSSQRMATCFPTVCYFYLFIYLFIYLGPKFLDSELSHPLTDCHKICTQIQCGIKAENVLLKIFVPTPKKIWRGKISIFENCHESEAHNFETA